MFHDDSSIVISTGFSDELVSTSTCPSKIYGILKFVGFHSEKFIILPVDCTKFSGVFIAIPVGNIKHVIWEKKSVLAMLFLT